MITLFLFLSLLILLIRIFSARLIIPAVGVFLPVSSLWMGFHMLTENESCLDNIVCVAPPFGQFSTLIGWFLIAESILTACAGVYFLRKNKKRWSRHDYSHVSFCKWPGNFQYVDAGTPMGLNFP